MMPDISLLESSLINQIAAGEVVERPASIVKELIENSLDAGANEITVVIHDGGHSLVHVTDNGNGMDKEDLKMAFQRHATSKISELDDLKKIKSLGFRGEALPSIASVSQINAHSSLDSKEGNEISIHGGELQYIRPSASLKGTTIQVKNIFYNTPVRRKFLKKKEVEQRAIISIVRKYALAFPEIKYILINEEREIYNLPIGDLQNRIISIYGEKVGNYLLPVSFTKGEFYVDGFIGNLSLVKKRQGDQFLLMNRRTIQDRLMNSAVYSSYRSLISRGEYPFFVLNLTIPHEIVDVNVHPAKLEVRFQDEWRVYYVLKSAINDALKDLLKVIPEFKPNPFNSLNLHGPGNQNLNLRFNGKPSATQEYALEQAPRPEGDAANSNCNGHSFPDSRIQKAHDRVEEMMTYPNKESFSAPSRIWQIHNKYIVAEVKSGLIIIDQHVAHERILFETAQEAMEGNGLPSQTVLFPQTLSFQPDEYSQFMQISPYLEKMGFKFREFGESTIIIEGVPPDIYMGSENRIIREVLDNFIEHHKLNSSFLDYIASEYACKAAIKAGEKLESEEMKTLVDKLFSTKHPYYCPHGRPIIVNLSTEELDKRFERH